MRVHAITRGVAAAAGLALGAALAWLAPVAPWRPDGPAGLDVPRAEVVSGWVAAEALAGMALYRPADTARGAPRLVVRGVPGDPTRPVAATWDDGLEILQAHRDVLPGPDPEERFPIEGSDEAWRATVHERAYVYARQGDVLVLLSGRPDAELVALAASLLPVEP